MKQLITALLVVCLVACEPSRTGVVDICEPFPISEAESLISNADTDARKIDGPILAAAAVRDPHQTPQGSDLWVIAINVDGVVILLAHNVQPGDNPDGPGFWAALDEVSSQITGFPTNSNSPNPWPITKRGEAWDCVS